MLAINAERGFGKTFLLKNWAEDLKKTGHPTLYFDAWANYFTPEPLIAFIFEIDPTSAKGKRPKNWGAL